MERVSRPEGAGRAWLALESALATGLALYLTLRLDRPTVWAFVPLALLLLVRRRPEDYGLDLAFRPPSWRAHLALGIAALTGYALLHVLVVGWIGGASLSPRLPAAAGWLLAEQLVVIAFPEELFFRGYLQTNLNRIFGRPWLFGGARLGPALPLQAAVFALCHLAGGDWSRLRVFFFGLLAGWLRERSGSIAAPVAYHGIANFWYAALSASLR